MNLSEDTRNLVRRPMPATAPASRTALQQRTERALVMAWPQIRYQLMRTGAAGLTGLAALLAAGVAVIALLLPAHRSIVALRSELTTVGHAVPAAAPIEQSPQHFAATLPTRAQIPALLGLVLV